MGLKEWFVGKKEVEQVYIPTIVTDELSKVKMVEEQFKGEVDVSKKVKFPAELGEEHPFNFSMIEELYKRFGFLTAVVDKYVDFVVGPGFYVECEDERGKKIIDDFMNDVNFPTFLRTWAKEGVLKGTGVAELGGGPNEVPQGLKVLNANYMYVNRNKMGEIEGFKQYRGAFNKFDRNQIIDFEPYQIAYFPFNTVGDCAYGLGITYPALTTINNLLKNEKDLHMLINRKANSPYHIKLGGVFGGKYYKPNASDVTKIGKELEYQTNKLEWTTDGLTEIKVLDFGNIGEKFDAVLKYDRDMLFYIFQIPAVIMGMANVPEGLAKVQMDAFERRIQAIQAEMEKVIEHQIFKRVLIANGLDVKIDFRWGQPSDSQKMERLMRLKELMNNLRVSDSLMKLMEQDVVKLLDYDENEYEMMSEEEERRREEERPQPIVPGENSTKPQFILPKQKTQVKQRYEMKEECKYCEESWEKINDLKEWLGFSYKTYLKSISSFIKQDDFINLKAENDVEEAAGYFNNNQVNELKRVLNTGFVKGKGIREISRDIDLKVKPGDLYEVVDNKIGNLVRKGDSRSIVIARTEITRVANEGAIKQFEDGGVSKIRWVASSGDRTCPTCEELNGQVRTIHESFNVNNFVGTSPPAHVNCRCTTVPITEIK